MALYDAGIVGVSTGMFSLGAGQYNRAERYLAVRDEHFLWGQIATKAGYL